MCENKELLIRAANWQRVFNEVLTRHIPRLIILLYLAHPMAVSQPLRGKTLIDSLKESEVIFVLPTSRRKLTVLQDQALMSTKGRIKNRRVKLLEAEKNMIDSFILVLQGAVRQHFTFAQYSFVPDTALASTIARRADHDQPYFLVRRAPSESGATALVLFNPKMQALSRPIPYYARITKMTSVIDAFFGRSTYPWRDLNAVIAKWSERLERFYQDQ